MSSSKFLCCQASAAWRGNRKAAIETSGTPFPDCCTKSPILPTFTTESAILAHPSLTSRLSDKKDHWIIIWKEVVCPCSKIYSCKRYDQRRCRRRYSNKKFDLHSRARECLAHSPPLPRCGSAQRIFQSPPLTNRRPRSYFLIVLALVAKQLGRRGMQPSERIFGETIQSRDCKIGRADGMQRCRDGIVFGPKVTFACTKIHPDHRWLSLDWRSRTERKTIWVFSLPLFWSVVIHLVGLISRRVVSLSSFGRVSGADAEKRLLHPMHLSRSLLAVAWCIVGGMVAWPW